MLEARAVTTKMAVLWAPAYYTHVKFFVHLHSLYMNKLQDIVVSTPLPIKFISL